MCAIAGYVGRDAEQRWEAAAAMLLSLAYRGECAPRLAVSPSFAVGAVRFPFVGGRDGAQPLHDPDGRWLLVCNGEIFNHGELMRDLGVRRPFSSSDCEVLVHLFDCGRLDLLDRVDGQFAFALVDTSSGTTYLGRDRFGICPLFYAAARPGVAFASEAKALFRAGFVEPRLRLQSLLETAVLYGPTPPATCFHEVLQVEPGSVVTVGPGDSARRTQRFGDQPARQAPPVDDASFSAALERAVRRRLPTGERVGILLSGGIDSSAIAAITAETGADAVCYSLSFAESELDESPHQQAVAEHLGLPWQRLPFDLATETAAVLPSVVRLVESPFARPGPVAMWALARAIRRDGTRLTLTGEGADELLLGYPYFADGLSGAETKLALWRRSRHRIFTSDALKQMSLDECATYLRDRRLDGARSGAPAATSRRLDVETKLSRYLLAHQGERVFLGNTVEARYPFLDTFLWSFGDRVGTPNGKRILRSAMAGRLPSAILERKKQGYLAPSLTSRTALNLRDLADEVSPATCRRFGIFRGAAVARMQAGGGSADDRELRESAHMLASTTHILFGVARQWRRDARSMDQLSASAVVIDSTHSPLRTLELHSGIGRLAS
jgi:asparagine synthase (glutamine-hydrolysing)